MKRVKDSEQVRALAFRQFRPDFVAIDADDGAADEDQLPVEGLDQRLAVVTPGCLQLTRSAHQLLIGPLLVVSMYGFQPVRVSRSQFDEICLFMHSGRSKQV